MTAYNNILDMKDEFQNKSHMHKS